MEKMAKIACNEKLYERMCPVNGKIIRNKRKNIFLSSLLRGGQKTR
jgi:hypothetical protein